MDALRRVLLWLCALRAGSEVAAPGGQHVSWAELLDRSLCLRRLRYWESLEGFARRASCGGRSYCLRSFRLALWLVSYDR